MAVTRSVLRLAAVLAVAAGVVVPTTSEAAFPGRNGKIAFVRAGDIYTTNVDGSGLKRLTTTRNNGNPAWSADGQRIAFDSRRTGSGDVYVMRADGSGVQRITTTTARESQPTWSPDGTRLAYAKAGRNCQELFVVRITPTRGAPGALTNDCADPDIWVENDEPDWSADGTRIAYSRFKYDKHGSFFNSQDLVYLVVATKRRHDVHNGLFDYLAGPNWAPGSKALLFSCYEEDNPEICPNSTSSDIYRIRPDGSGVARLTKSGRATQPAGSPDGTLFAYTYGEGSTAQVRVGNAAGQFVRTVASNASQPNWQPLP